MHANYSTGNDKTLKNNCDSIQLVSLSEVQTIFRFHFSFADHGHAGIHGDCPNWICVDDGKQINDICNNECQPCFWSSIISTYFNNGHKVLLYVVRSAMTDYSYQCFVCWNSTTFTLHCVCCICDQPQLSTRVKVNYAQNVLIRCSFVGWNARWNYVLCEFRF